MIYNLKEKITPVSSLDAALSARLYLGSREPNNMDDCAVPQEFSDLFSLAVARKASHEDYISLIGALAKWGLAATILASADVAISESPAIAELHAAFFNIRASVQEQVGMRWASAVDRRIWQRLTDQINRDEELPGPEDGRFQIVDAWNQPDQFATLSKLHMSELLRNDPLRDPIITKQNHLSGGLKPVQGIHVDFSFFVLDSDDTPILQVECDTSHCFAPLRCRESPILIVALSSDMQAIAPAVSLALDQLLWINSWAGTRGISIELDVETDVGKALRQVIPQITSNIITMRRGGVNLLRDDDCIFNSYRENHRRSIRKGLEHLDIKMFECGDPDAVVFYSMMHHKIERFQVLSDERIAKILSVDGCRLYGAYRDGEPVGMTLVTGHGHTAYYAAGITAGEDKLPIGHALMHRAIIGAKNDGFRKFDFGLLDVAPDSDLKMASIAQFKLGFCDDVYDRVIVHSNIM